MTVRAVGIDGAPGGWVVAEAGLDPSSPPVVHFVETLAPALDELFGRVPGAVAAVDMPIGLSDDGDRLADREARSALGHRRSTFFPTPIRAVLDCETWDEANDMSRAHSGRGLSRQSWNLVPKIREVDACWSNDRIDQLIEAHPESSFAVMAGTPLDTKKTTAEGRAARLDLLAQHVHDDIDGVIAGAPHVLDAIDALALVWTARRKLTGEAMMLGDQESRDAAGRPMRLTV